MTVPPAKRMSMARQREAQIAHDDAEVARLQARVRELEATNEALGKAIGLLHEMNAHRARRHPDDPRSRRFIDAENELVAELTEAIGSQRRALAMIGLSRSTWHYRSHPRPRVTDPLPQRDRAYRSRIGEADRASDREPRSSPAGWRARRWTTSFATIWDAGVMLASRRSWWRIAAAIEDQSARPIAPTRSTNKAPRAGAGTQSDWPATDLELGHHRPAQPVAGCGVQGVLDHRHLLPQDRGLAGRGTRMRRPGRGHVRGRVRRTRTARGRARRLRAGDALDGPQRPPGRSRDRPDPQPATGQQRQPVLRIGVPHHEVPAELSRRLRRPRRRPRLGERLRVLVQPAPPPQRHRAVHPRPRSTAAPGHSNGPTATTPYRPTTTPTPNDSATVHTPTVPAPSSASTCPPKRTPTDSTQLDNARQRG